MGEFNWGGETYTEGAGGNFVESKLFDKLMANDTTVSIYAIRSDDQAMYQNRPAPAWLVDFYAPDGEEYTKSLGKGNSERDARMLRLTATIEATGEPIDARFGKIGKRIEVLPPIPESE
jgi:hypothetical protein